MNDKLEDLLYESGLTAQGCWDEFDDYAKQGIERFAELIVRECVQICQNNDWEDQQGWGNHYAKNIKKKFGVE